MNYDMRMSCGEFALPAQRDEGAPASSSVGRPWLLNQRSTAGAARLKLPRQPAAPQPFRCGPVRTAFAALLLYGAAAAAHDNSPTELRQFVDQQVGGIGKLRVPAKDSDLPQPRLANGRPDPFFETTEAKRYLGKLLFHDPVRTARIHPEFGGAPQTKQTASCGSCHFGEAASKSGTLLNFAVGGEGRGYTDAKGN
ncbi:MAG: hypothetical protein H6R26_1254, partial [Proteobacteria bacterium]|nr:hypothetical protein [Pseudomonadota bacterium]